MTLRPTLFMLVCTATLGLSGGAGAQQTGAAKVPPAPQGAPVKKPAATLYYDNYQASQRLRLRSETCMQDEDMMAQYCVKKCEAGYLVVSGKDLPRLCRSEKSLPPGQLPQALRIQKANPPPPPPPSKPTPGF